MAGDLYSFAELLVDITRIWLTGAGTKVSCARVIR